MPDLAELGAAVKAKYPGSYDHVSDYDLAAKVKEKYPGSYPQYSVPGMEKMGGIPPKAGQTPTVDVQEHTPFPEQDIPGAPGMAYASRAGNQIARGVESMAGGEKAHGASQIVRGGGNLVSPALIGALPAAPAATISGMVTGGLAGAGTEAGLNAAGVDPGKSELAGDAASVIGGGLGTNIPRIGPAIANAAGSLVRHVPLSADVVGLLSPRLAHGMRLAGRLGGALASPEADVRPILGPHWSQAPEFQAPDIPAPRQGPQAFPSVEVPLPKPAPFEPVPATKSITGRAPGGLGSTAQTAAETKPLIASPSGEPTPTGSINIAGPEGLPSEYLESAKEGAVAQAQNRFNRVKMIVDAARTQGKDLAKMGPGQRDAFARTIGSGRPLSPGTDKLVLQELAKPAKSLPKAGGEPR